MICGVLITVVNGQGINVDGNKGKCGSETERDVTFTTLFHFGVIGTAPSFERCYLDYTQLHEHPFNKQNKVLLKLINKLLNILLNI